MPKLLFVVTEDWAFVSHRLSLAVEAKRKGFEVVVVTRFKEHFQAIQNAGLRPVPFSMNRRSLNPFYLLSESLELVGILRRERPDILHLVALRPVFVGSLAGFLTKTPKIVAAITGMGFLFTDDKRSRWTRGILQRMLPYILKKYLTLVQNNDDAKQLEALGLCPSMLRMIPGAGVNVGEFTVNEEPPKEKPIVMMAARLLWDKGVKEFVEAADILRGVDVRFVLVGAVDAGNPTSVPEMQVHDWVQKGTIEWWGHAKDMPTVLAQASFVCLPSYREGFPKVLLEAMACGKACVTTDVPGCRAAVKHNENGLLIPVRNSRALAGAILLLIENPDIRKQMGRIGRTRAEKHFSTDIITDMHLELYSDLLGLTGVGSENGKNRTVRQKKYIYIKG